MRTRKDSLLLENRRQLSISGISAHIDIVVVCEHTHAEFYNHNNKNKNFISLLPENIISRIQRAYTFTDWLNCGIMSMMV